MGDLDSARSYIDDALAVGGRGHGPKVLRCAISVLQTCGDIQASEQVAAMARRIVLECAEQWPTDPRDDGAELRGTLDGPSRASFLNIPDVVWILAQTAEMKASHGETRPFHSVTTKALKTRAGEGGMTQETEGGPGPHGVPGWEVMATAPAGDKMGDLVAQWLHAFIRHMRAERGFVVRASGDIVAARDLDGEVISSARRKLPEAAVQKALEQGTPWRAQGETGGAVLALPVTFASVSPDEGVEHWVVVLQNRFVPDAFEPRLEGSDLAPWLGPLMVLARLDALGRLVAENRLRLADAEKRQQREHTRSTEEILRLRRELETTREHVGPAHDYSEIVFESAPMKRMLLRVDRIIDTALPVYVLGESGTGKELIARAIHGQGPRREGPFVAQNCSAIPASLFESQFFGHERGAFTGAERANEGLFRRASGGTLFLDEIGDLPLDLQAKLLRVLETSEVRPLGGRRTFKVDVRIICATHRDLKMLVETKRFREDLYYRLNVVRVDVPPLRDRPDDIAPLVQHFLQGRIGPGNPLPQLGPGVAKALVRYDWPGNVRQLENEMTRAALLCDGMIQLADLSEEVRASRGGSAAKRLGGLEGGFAGTLRLDRGTMKDRVGRLETWVLSDALERHGGNKSSVARELGLSRAGLNMKLKRLALWETKET